MLVLSRFPDQSIIIGEDVVVTVVSVIGDKVRLGITAPADVRIDRREIHEAICRERGEPVPDGLFPPRRPALGRRNAHGYPDRAEGFGAGIDDPPPRGYVP